jgi:hypothetical protein
MIPEPTLPCPLAGKVVEGAETEDRSVCASGTAAGVLVVAFLVAVPANGQSLSTLSLRAPFASVVTGTDCPAGTPNTTSCYSDHGTALVPGLGSVGETFEEMISGPTSCTHTTFGPAVLEVAGKGELDASLTDANTCNPPFTDSVSDPFTITGGTGPYAAATGTGTLTFSAFEATGGSSAKEMHTWVGQVAAGTDFDTTAPMISLARPIIAKTRTRTARVHYAVAATDAVDGTVSVTCKPKSGSRFPIGKTRVACSATDGSDNTATVRFTITVKRLH